MAADPLTSPDPRQVTAAAAPGGRNLASEEGFGLIELVIAMMVLAVGISALIAMFTSTSLSLRRAALAGTATTLADKQMEAYRAATFTQVRIDSTLLPGGSDPYVTASQSDAAIPQSTGQAAAGSNGDTACPTSSPPSICLPVQSVTGPDGHSYRIDSYVLYVNNNGTLSSRTAASGLDLKRVTVVVRDGNNTSTILARISSAFERNA